MITLRAVRQAGRLEAGQQYVSKRPLLQLSLQTGRFERYSPIFRVSHVIRGAGCDIEYETINKQTRTIFLPFYGEGKIGIEDKNSEVPTSDAFFSIYEDDLMLLNEANNLN